MHDTTRRGRSRGAGFVLTSLFAGGFSTFAGAAWASTITVNSLADNLTAGDAQCTLREALANANANADTTQGDCVAGSGVDVLNLTALSGTIVLSGGQLTVTSPLTVTGPGADVLAISANSLSRVFYIYNNASDLNVSISGVTIRDGRPTGETSNGGGLSNKGETLTLDRVTLSANRASGGGGGVASIGGSLTIRSSLVTGNTAQSTAGGAGVYVNGGGVTISGSTLSSNTVSSLVGRGGAIALNAMTLPSAITNTSIVNNSTSGKGAAIGVRLNGGPATLTIDQAVVTGNTSNGRGGAFFLYRLGGAVTITRSNVSGNTTQNRGGGLFLYRAEAPVLIQDTSISNNNASTAAGNGGGIFFYRSVASGSLTLDRVTMAGNAAARAGGAIFLYKGSSAVTIQNSTISGNTSGTTGGAIFDRGPFSGAPSLSILNSTIFGNSAGSAGGNLHVTLLPTTIRNSVVAGGSAPTAPDFASGSSNATVNYTLVQNASGATFSGTGNIVGQAAGLGPLAANGGPTATHSPLSDSPVLNTGEPGFTGQSVDQRGAARIRNGRLDIGSVEAGLLLPAQTLAGQVGEPFGASFGASGGFSPYTYTISAGSVPPGLTFNGPSGVLFGTPTGGGTFNFTVTVIDGSGERTSQPYTLTVAAPTIAVTTSTLEPARVGEFYQAFIQASGGTGNKTFTATGLPPGLTLSSFGVLSGTPRQGGPFDIVITATDASANAGPYRGNRTLRLTVAAPSLALTPESLPATTRGTAVSRQFSATGGTPGYTYAVTRGALPAGVTLSSTGLLAGTLAASGVFDFDVTVTDSSASPAFTGVRTYAWSVAAPTLSLSTLTGGSVGATYRNALTTSGGTGPYTYAVTSGALPPGLTLSETGDLSGTPTQGGTFTFTVTATDSSGAGGPYTGARTYEVAIAEAAVVVTPETLPAGRRGDMVLTQFTATGGTAPYAWAVTSGALPAGVTLSTSGTLSGVLAASGSFTFTVTATDSSGTTPYSGSRTITWAVSAPTVGLGALPDGAVATPYQATATASGGTAPYTFAVTAGALPPGLTLSSDGRISGRPTEVGGFDFTLSATDASTDGGPYVGTRAYTVTIAVEPVTLPRAGLPGGRVGAPYSASLALASGGTPPYAYRVSGGALPAGLSLSPQGEITGTPTQSGSYAFTVEATDSASPAARGVQSYTLEVQDRVAPAPIPTLGEWAMGLLAGVLGALGLSAAGRARRRSGPAA